MFRLIKLGFYVMFGYFVYEMYVGMTSDSQHAPQRRKGARGGRNMAGSGKGQKVRTEDADGASESHVVGRGVDS